jgi:von Willebrand factor type A domain
VDQPIVFPAKVSAKRLALVVDRSGSMSGEPLTVALRCVMHIASCMTPVDQLAVVVYDDEANVLLPISTVKATDAIHSIGQRGKRRLYHTQNTAAILIHGAARSSAVSGLALALCCTSVAPVSKTAMMASPDLCAIGRSALKRSSKHFCRIMYCG